MYMQILSFSVQKVLLETDSLLHLREHCVELIRIFYQKLNIFSIDMLLVFKIKCGVFPLFFGTPA